MQRGAGESNRGVAAQQMREPERLDALLAAVCNNASAALFVQDEKRHCIYMNPAAERLTGFKLGEVRDRPLHYLVHHTRPDGSSYPIGECPIDRAFPDDRKNTGEEVFVRKDGTFYHVEYAASPLREEGTIVGTMIEVHDITRRKRKDVRERFLMRLNSALQSIEDPDEAIATAAQMLGEFLEVDRCAYAEVEEDEDHLDITGDYVRNSMPHVSGRFPVTVFGAQPVQLRENRPFVAEDVLGDERIGKESAAHFEGASIRSLISVPLLKEDRLVAVMAVHQQTPRKWSTGEVELVVTVANRCWEALERARVTRDLRESEQRFRQALSIETVGVIFWDANAVMLDANEAFLRMSGRTREEAAGLSWRDLTPPEFVPVSERALRELNEAGEMTPYEKRYYRKDGSTWWGLFAARKLNDEEIVEFVLDVSERKEAEEEVRRLNSQLERRVADRTAELEEANRELEAFSYSVSHDLRAPLRGIDGFSRALFEDYRETLDGDARKYLERIRAGARRMKDLIDDMLAFSRTSRMNLNRTSVDMSALAEQVADDLRRAQPDRQVEIEVEPGVRALGDRKQLRIVFDNLLGNALKFTRGEERAHIDFGSLREDGKTVYFVRDNGTGFSMEYADKLFVPFQRLHAGEFEGSGVGLATVQRVIHKHGGRIWADAKPDVGATFYFTLPSE